MDLHNIPPSDLHLDPKNPRIGFEKFSLNDQQGILHWLWRNNSVDELVNSILANGYWKHEELFATDESGKLVVVEGNRRLAAVRIISDAPLRGKLGVKLNEEPSPRVLETIQELPVILAPRKELWSFVGFKHVNGPQAWDSIGKAEYVFNVRTNFGMTLAEIASGIGDRHETVTRLYRGYVVLRQAQDQLAFDITQSEHLRFPFSHLWTALGYASIQGYLGVNSKTLENENPVEKGRLSRLDNLMNWLYGNRAKNIEAKVRRQNPDLRHLARALEKQKGIDLLESGSPLLAALEASLGDKHLFRNALTKADNSAREAMQYVSTGFDGEHDLIATMESLHRQVESLKSLMERGAS
ncbi:MAG: hypothetical protein F4065_09540 [Rhodothermaceae bacterium]|nr:hypothetical protein [Rhodothermaceae bacterium]MXZ57241.1 hypothetical protein [Rhodothermaceae bacterium]MYB90937.1 hypothetical protein [Rhodothermaceae bacterium]MYD67812.1 hypothetical protein [Rhodothermaceae bacterium]MYG45107.1 hypothetical protein [Rhodothermaceae bacterium]